MASCGDGYVQADVEACDDGNAENNDACLDTCEVASCGDGFVEEGVEDCDDGNMENTDECVDGCVAAACGDGFVQEGVEDCDDGNVDDGDGCSAECKSEVDAQCGMPYNTFTQGGRLHTNPNGPIYCDNSNSSPEWKGAGWYRFTGAAGVKMPESAPPTYRCSTHAPGWLNGAHPTPDQGKVNRQVCFHWSNNSCNWNSSIQVVNCGDFYLYSLPQPPVCSLRYCGSN
jgi:cysteine-rich repeat protein